ncbi:MAG: hypothetical protein A7315_07200 [Candidatus Altiarchaeales archaeon WOR_SM1_79]|nr:MAG: hypothetical protein A7315_07200 [Candidatus Altiarchaeales archaeon WOR_SM1_79]
MELNLVGEVKNLGDGTVEVITEGEKETLETFMDAIRVKKYPIDVTEVSPTFDKPTGEFDTFRVIMGDLQEEMFEAISGGTTAVKHIQKTLDRMEKTQDEMKQTQDNILGHVEHIPAIEENTADTSPIHWANSSTGWPKWNTRWLR